MRSGKTKPVVWIVGAVVLIALGIAVYGLYNYEPSTNDNNNGGSGGSSGGSSGACVCPDDLDWSGTINLQNPLNATGTETFDATMYFYNVDGSLKTSITDTTSGAATLECGRTYNVELLSTSGAAGDTGELLNGPDGSSIADGVATIKVCGSGNTLTFESNQHGLPEVRAKDIIVGDFCHDNSDGGATATDYETTDGIVFFSSTANTSITVDTGGELHVLEYVRANVEDQDVNDLGMWVLIDASTTVWDTPTVKIDGATANEASGKLNEDERIAYNDYEYVYYVPADRQITKNNELELDLSMFALSGQDPDGNYNVSIDYAPVGRYSSTESTDTLKVGAVDDSSSRSDVHTRFDTLIAIA